MKSLNKRSAAQRQMAHQFILGLAVLALGAAVYALDRPAGSVVFLPRSFAVDGGLFGPLAGPLPTFLHTMAFSLMTAALLAPTLRPRLAACGIWVAVNWLFEAAQHPAFNDLTGIGMRGAFDQLDLLAALLGAAMAFGVIWRYGTKEGNLA